MGQCVGKNRNGLRCLHSVKAGERCCYRHIEQDTTLSDSLLAVGVGAILGNLVAPGFGGFMGGALIAKAANWLSSNDGVKKKKVFVSFDFDNDRQLKHLLIGQSKHPSASFSVADWSLKEAAPEHNWQSKARNAIQRSDLVVVLVGRHTHRAPGVLAEVEMARLAKKQVVQLIGRSKGDYKRVPNAGRTYAWTKPNLDLLFSE